MHLVAFMPAWGALGRLASRRAHEESSSRNLDHLRFFGRQETGGREDEACDHQSHAEEQSQQDTLGQSANLLPPGGYRIHSLEEPDHAQDVSFGSSNQAPEPLRRGINGGRRGFSKLGQLHPQPAPFRGRTDLGPQPKKEDQWWVWKSISAFT